MKQLSKTVARQDASFKLSPSPSRETSINLSHEISDLISDDSGEVSFSIYKADLVKAIGTLCLIPKVFMGNNTEPSSPYEILQDLSQQITNQFGESMTATYSLNLLKRNDGRAYFNNLRKPNGFNFRSFLIEQLSEITFSKDDNGLLSMRLNTNLPQDASYCNIVQVAVINPLKDSYSDEELVNQLKKMNDSLGTTGIHLFGLKFGKFLADRQVKELSEIAAKAGIPESFGAELNKLKNVYKAIHEHKFGVSFYDEIRVSPKDISSAHVQNDRELDYLRAMRTKPFLLLAGISGTGKSRIVKQMAFDSCPDEGGLRDDPTSPGNYCLIEVKPNWHDSTELLGYESRIGGAHYQLTQFVKFLVKAMQHPTVPFFVCLDEMNLAPVEQYFAEFLSVLESRTKIDGHIVSEPLVKATIFANSDYELKLQDELFGLELKEEVTVDADGKQRIVSGKLPDDAQTIYDSLREHGLRIPDNVIVIGTVNMDETTHQFSRKVIDRAMTIEMNLPEGNPFMDFFDKPSNLAYQSIPYESSLYLATETRASDIIQALAKDNPEETENLKQQVAKFLTDLNDALEGTPFKVAYRVQNELMLYFHQLWLEKPDEEWNKILQTAADQILMMKVLPRIEGDEELLEKPLEKLASFCENYDNSRKKVEEMTERLKLSRFTSFWP